MAKINPDDALIKETYVRVLAREPSETELQRMTRYFQKVGRRGEAIEDLIWTLVNSAEFTTKR
jgi:hypothetical protein